MIKVRIFFGIDTLTVIKAKGQRGKWTATTQRRQAEAERK